MYLTKTVLKKTSNVIFSMKKVNIIFLLYLKAFLEEVIVMHTQKMRAKYMKEDVWKSFFVNLHVGISQLHYRLASKQYIIRDFK